MRYKKRARVLKLFTILNRSTIGHRIVATDLVFAIESIDSFKDTFPIIERIQNVKCETLF